VRLHTTVGCSHGDERRKYDSKRASSHAQAYVKLQSLSISVESCSHDNVYTGSMCVCVIHYRLNGGHNSNTVCASHILLFSSLLVPAFSFHFFFTRQLSSLFFPSYALNAR